MLPEVPAPQGRLQCWHTPPGRAILILHQTAFPDHHRSRAHADPHHLPRLQVPGSPARRLPECVGAAIAASQPRTVAQSAEPGTLQGVNSSRSFKPLIGENFGKGHDTSMAAPVSLIRLVRRFARLILAGRLPRRTLLFPDSSWPIPEDPRGSSGQVTAFPRA